MEISATFLVFGLLASTTVILFIAGIFSEPAQSSNGDNSDPGIMIYLSGVAFILTIIYVLVSGIIRFTV